LLYLDAEPADLHGYLNTVDKPLNQLTDDELCPGTEALERFNDALR
jgi:2-oxoglutarate/2-oxoacid ferredoxin oxidoreductase subunit beta